MKRVGIIIDAIAALRELGGNRRPDPVNAIALIEMAGADSIVYTMPEQITPFVERDLRIFKDCIHSHFNLRVPPMETAAQKAIDAGAEMATLIAFHNHRPGSVDLVPQETTAASVVRRLRTAGLVVNALIEPDANQLKSAVQIGCDYVEFNTHAVVHADSLTMLEQQLENLAAVAMAASKLKVGVTVSGDLDYSNVHPLIRMEAIEEINVGHAIITRALFVGFDHAVREFVALAKADR